MTDRIVHDLRHALRGLLRAPGFSAVAVLTLALGVAATTAIFTVLDAVVLSPLRYPDADRLAWIDSHVPGVGPQDRWGLSEAGYFHFREQARSFEALGAFSTAPGSLGGDEGAERVDLATITPEFAGTVGLRAALGRVLSADDARPDAPAVAVLGHGLWTRRFGADPGVVGRTIRLSGREVEVVGVMAAGTELPARPVDLWVPMPLDPTRPPENSHWLEVVGRLKPGVSAADAERELALLTGRFVEIFPQAYDEGFMRETGFATRVQPLRDKVVGDLGRTLWILLGAVGLVMLVACANVANLFLVRAEARRREVALRAALGAGAGRLAGHHLTEALVISLAAAAAGLAGAWAAVRALPAVAPEGLPRLGEVAVDGTTVLFALGLSAVAGVAFGLVPVLRGGADAALLRDGGRSATASRRRVRARDLLVAGQVALALLLLASAGLMLRSFERLGAVRPGFDAKGVLTLELSLPRVAYPAYDDVARFHRELADRVAALPGVVSVGATQKLPLKDTGGCSAVWAEGRPLGPEDQPPCVGTPSATPGFFASMGIPLEGREPTWDDVASGSGAVVVTRALAERLWPGEDALGKGIRGGGDRPPYYRVVGVTGDLRGEGLDQPATEAVYFPVVPIEGAGLWSPARSATLVVRTASDDPTGLTAAIRRTVAEMDGEVAVAGVRSMEEVVRRSLVRTSFAMVLLATASGVALLLAAVGLYGVIAYVVGQRRAEIGVRMALGARAGQVARMVVRHALGLAAAGVAVGTLAALGVTPVLESLLFGVSPTDPVTYGAVAAVLLGVALLASWLPARRAARVDPMEALRAE